jgi:hypothetical protein
MNRVEEDLLEADAKNRLYYLLGERTRREHMAIDQKVTLHSCVWSACKACSSAGWLPDRAFHEQLHVANNTPRRGGGVCSERCG